MASPPRGCCFIHQQSSANKRPGSCLAQGGGFWAGQLHPRPGLRGADLALRRSPAGPSSPETPMSPVDRSDLPLQFTF